MSLAYRDCFLSDGLNHRTDTYGGSLENRVRFARMLTRAIRKAVPDMVIDYKLSIVTPQRGKGGIDEADAVPFAQWLRRTTVSPKAWT